GGLRNTPGGTSCERPVPPCEAEERAFRRSTCGVLRCAGRAFENVDQPRLSASSWRRVLLPGSGAPPSPESPECVAPNPRRRIDRWRDFPGHRPGGVRPHLRPCPHRCSVFTASHDDAPRRAGRTYSRHIGLYVNRPTLRFFAGTARDADRPQKLQNRSSSLNIPPVVTRGGAWESVCRPERQSLACPASAARHVRPVALPRGQTPAGATPNSTASVTG